MTAPSVAVIIVNYNGGAFLSKLASSLAGLTYPNWRLWLVDNASTDGSADLLPGLFPQAETIYNQRNLGLAPAINQALTLCLEQQPDYVLLLNPDTTQAPDCLNRLVAAADRSTLVVPLVLSTDEGTQAGHAGGFDWLTGRLRDTHDGEPADAARPREVEVGSFSCMLLPAQAFRLVGPLDERLALYYEDTDFSARARKAGLRIVVEPSAVIHHDESASSGGSGSPFRAYYAARNRPYVMRKHAGTARYAAFSLFYLSTRLLRAVDHARRGDWPLLRAQMLALRDFYLGRMGMTYQPRDFR